MSASDIIRDARRRRVTLYVVAGRTGVKLALGYRCAPGALTPDLRADLRRHRDIIIGILAIGGPSKAPYQWGDKRDLRKE